jgi:hypothetical protein
MFVLWGFVADFLDVWHRTSLWHALTDKPELTIGLGIGAAILLWMEGVAILRAWPGSPFFYLEISALGMTCRKLTSTQAVTWAEIEHLNLVERMQRSGKQRKMHWWVLAETSQWTDDHDVDRRIKQALLAYDTDELASMFSNSKEAARDLLIVLRDLRSSVAAGDKVTAINLPQSLRRVAVSGASGVNPAAAKGKIKTANKPRSVIER